MVAKKPGRYLAPLALVAVLAAVLLVVRAGVGHHSLGSPVVHQLPVSRPLVPQQAFYVIKPGDNLSEISVKTGVPVATLEALNPAVDPSALQTGQRLRLRH